MLFAAEQVEAWPFFLVLGLVALMVAVFPGCVLWLQYQKLRRLQDPKAVRQEREAELLEVKEKLRVRMQEHAEYVRRAPEAFAEQQRQVQMQYAEGCRKAALAFREEVRGLDYRARVLESEIAAIDAEVAAQTERKA